MKIEFNHYDLQVKTLNNGDRVVQINPRLAFDNDFIKAMEEQGVKEYIQNEEEAIEEEVGIKKD